MMLTIQTEETEQTVNNNSSSGMISYHKLHYLLFHQMQFNSPRGSKTERNDLRKIICLRKSEVSVVRISVCYITENMVEHGIHCLPCSYINDVINMLP